MSSWTTYRRYAGANSRGHLIGFPFQCQQLAKSRLGHREFQTRLMEISLVVLCRVTASLGSATGRCVVFMSMQLTEGNR